MARRSKRAPPPPPIKCIFCGTGGERGNPMSEEHLWSKWMGRLLPRGGDLEYVEFADIGPSSQSPGSRLYRSRRGAASTKTLKVVCKHCNETWMSGMETAVAPRLTPLIRGEPAVLNDRDQQILADWIMLKVFIAEHTSYPGFPVDSISTKEQRELFRVLREIPFGVRMWIVRHTGEKWKSAIFGETTGLAPPGVPLPPPPRPKNTQVITFGVGQLLVHVLWTTWEPVYNWLRLENMAPPFRQLWPLGEHAIRWPTFYTLTDDDADRLVSSFGALIDGPNVLRIDG